jgi:hypothetical protein
MDEAARSSLERSDGAGLPDEDANLTIGASDGLGKRPALELGLDHSAEIRKRWAPLELGLELLARKVLGPDVARTGGRRLLVDIDDERLAADDEGIRPTAHCSFPRSRWGSWHPFRTARPFNADARLSGGHPAVNCATRRRAAKPGERTNAFQISARIGSPPCPTHSYRVERRQEPS